LNIDESIIMPCAECPRLKNSCKNPEKSLNSQKNYLHGIPEKNHDLKRFCAFPISWKISCKMRPEKLQIFSSITSWKILLTVEHLFRLLSKTVHFDFNWSIVMLARILPRTPTTSYYHEIEPDRCGMDTHTHTQMTIAWYLQYITYDSYTPHISAVANFFKINHFGRNKLGRAE
jgi:hypothetical protein